MRKTVTIIYNTGVERTYPIVETKTFKCGDVLHTYEVVKGHMRCVLEARIDENGKVPHSKTGWQS